MVYCKTGLTPKLVLKEWDQSKKGHYTHKRNGEYKKMLFNIDECQNISYGNNSSVYKQP